MTLSSDHRAIFDPNRVVPFQWAGALPPPTISADFVGVRFKLVRGGKIFTFHQRKSISATVTFEIDPDEDDDDQITWDEFWDIQRELEQKALSELVAEFPFANKYDAYC